MDSDYEADGTTGLDQGTELEMDSNREVDDTNRSVDKIDKIYAEVYKKVRRTSTIKPECRQDCKDRLVHTNGKGHTTSRRHRNFLSLLNICRERDRYLWLAVALFAPSAKTGVLGEKKREILGKKLQEISMTEWRNYQGEDSPTIALRELDESWKECEDARQPEQSATRQTEASTPSQRNEVTRKPKEASKSLTEASKEPGPMTEYGKDREHLFPSEVSVLDDGDKEGTLPYRTQKYFHNLNAIVRPPNQIAHEVISWQCRKLNYPESVVSEFQTRFDCDVSAEHGKDVAIVYNDRDLLRAASRGFCAVMPGSAKLDQKASGGRYESIDQFLRDVPDDQQMVDVQVFPRQTERSSGKVRGKGTKKRKRCEEGAAANGQAQGKSQCREDCRDEGIDGGEESPRIEQWPVRSVIEAVKRRAIINCLNLGGCTITRTFRCRRRSNLRGSYPRNQILVYAHAIAVDLAVR